MWAHSSPVSRRRVASTHLSPPKVPCTPHFALSFCWRARGSGAGEGAGESLEKSLYDARVEAEVAKLMGRWTGESDNPVGGAHQVGRHVMFLAPSPPDCCWSSLFLCGLVKSDRVFRRCRSGRRWKVVA